jgi:PhnB protein
MSTVNPYLHFEGNCEEAFDFYKSVFGGEFASHMRWKDMKCDAPPPEYQGNKIMHVSLPVGLGTVLMGSDRPGEMEKGTIGDNFSIAIGPDSKEEATRIFNGLSAGGKVTMSLEDTFWGAYFGMFTDKFGIQWMVNYDYNLER